MLSVVERSLVSDRRMLVAVMVASVFLAACSSASTGSAPADTTSSDLPTSTTVAFEPPPGVVSIDYPSQPGDVPWPDGEWPEGPVPPGVDGAALQAHLDRAFGELSPSDLQATDAVVVVQGGRIVAERYRPGFGDRDTVHRSWSMAKSFTHTLVGILVRDGRLDIETPAPVPEWEEQSDPRHEITTDQLLRMASGLAWKEDYFAPDSDTVAMLAGVGESDMAHYAADKPLEVPPGSRVRYSTGTSNILAGIIGHEVGTGDAYEAFIDDELLAPLGIELGRTRLGWDGAGQLIGGSVFDLTARDFARFGLLNLRGGEWDGTRIVPEAWVDYGRTPTPAPAGTEGYGAHWWTYDECEGGFRAGGLNGQHIVICPDLDLVVVVLSNRVDGRDGEVRDEIVELFRAGS
jgi:CubicO group peptidase (beta-lactamase class C family)